MTVNQEPHVTLATVRQAGDDIHIECHFSDGQKLAAITVDGEFPRMARMIAGFLNDFASDVKDLQKDHT